MESPSLAVFFLMFVFMYLFGYLVVFRSWGPKHRLEAASSFMSLAHGTPAAAMAVFAVLHAGDFAAPNTHFQSLVLEYSIAYFLVDLLHYVLFYPHDLVFICHHLAVLYVFVTCHYFVHHGAVPILVLLALAEFTSGCQNAWSLAGYRRADAPAAAKFQDALSPYFYTYYSVLRGGVAPVFLLKIGMFYVSGAADNVIPKWAWISWMAVIATAILVSILWIGNHWALWFRQRKLHEKTA